MEKEYEIVRVDEPDWGLIGGGISRYNTEQAGEGNYQSLCYVLRSPDGESAMGGIICATYWGWLYVDLLWIDQEVRGQGYGHQLLTLAEKEARERGAKHAYLDTFTFQAPDFYEAHGYEVFGTLDDFLVGHRRFFMKKDL